MPDAPQTDVARALDALADDLIFNTAEVLRVELSGIAPSPPYHSEAQRRQDLATTARRFHELVQLGAALDWSLAEAEYTWMWRVLGRRGVTLDQHLVLVDAYFGIAESLRRWAPAERLALGAVAEQVRALATLTYAAAAAEPIVPA